jgi:hypothetical protein
MKILKASLEMERERLMHSFRLKCINLETFLS